MAVAHQIGAHDVDVGVEGNVQPDHLRAEVMVSFDQIPRDHPVLQDLLVVIDVVQEQVQRGDPLRDACLQMLPFRCGDHPRDDVERQDAVDGVLVGIDDEGDAEIVKLPLRILRASAQFIEVECCQPLADQRRMFGRQVHGSEQLVEVQARIVG